MKSAHQFVVDKTDLAAHAMVEHELPALAEGDVLAKVDRFAITANNITYGVVGERIGYWKFFPVVEAGTGIIPVWGFADIVESRNQDISEGERLYGYWPMGSHLVMTPTKVKPPRLMDGVTHRAELPPVYNAYSRVRAEDGYDPAMDDERMVLYPLYATSYCLYDFSKDNDWFGAAQVIIPSASSKTAIGTAYAFKEDPAAPKLVGVTSARNEEAVRALDLYDDVILYDDIETGIDSAIPALIIDMSGNGPIIGRLHRLLGENMRYTSNVGITHYDAGGMDGDYIKERSAMFFAPGHIQKRTAEWGPGVFEKKAFGFWKNAAIQSRGWLKIERNEGAGALARVYEEVLAGKTAANVGHVVAL